MRFSYLAVATALVTLTSAAAVAPKQQCRCLPGDACWPSTASWDALNATVGGRLVATAPIGSPCHDPTYDAEACAALQSSWSNPLTHLPSSSSVMQSYFANQSCDPFTDRAIPCTLGNYVSYAVDVQSAEHVSSALKFAKDNNLRVVVRNTGHDFLGRSTGAGALAIWTNHLKSMDFTTWSDEHYSGPAVKAGAGVLGYEVLEAAHAEGLAVVTGECATVGLAGGFIQGGGHSALSTEFGLAADQALAFDVVTADGETVVASPSQNADLYWALSGGGGGTFGVVTAVTVRAHPEETVGGAGFQLLAATTTPDKFSAAVSKFHELLPAMTDEGAMAVFLHNSQFLALRPLTVWNSTAAHVRDVVLAPFTKAVEEIGISLQVAYSELSYRDHYARYMGPLPQGNLEVTRYQFGGRLIPREVIENNNGAYQAVVKHLTDNGVLLAGSVAQYNKPDGAPDNSVHPAWRKAIMQLQMITNWDNAAPWADMEASQARMTDEFMPLIQSVTPGSASYMNEADFRQPDWQNAFFGDNYAKLLAIKNKYDPESVFYVLKGVGSEAWDVAPDGKMCRA
ncbi:FAD binding domain-containing protein [Colletotrichum falcatum]|nr:FAD binding domain-containing protein [Colletotrichum falcatum]